ncbi:MAG: amino acid adenylation domain-containing protein, partial [Acidobacteria bacterium]|nr:amino acid adenylation domain-containing protein [Acidobacteriota bacterium]
MSAQPELLKLQTEDKTLHQSIEEQAVKTPDRIAVTESGRCVTLLTYHELAGQSGRLAGLLIEKGVRANTIIGIKVAPSNEMIIGIFGILKTGGAYMPIDPGSPQQRIDYMLKDSKARLTIDYEFLKEVPRAPLHPSTAIPHHSNQLAYVIYTSGTTGKPKGALIEHRNVVNYANWFSKKAGLNGDDQTILTSSFSFDLGYTTVFPSLLSGSRLHMAAKQMYMSPGYLLNYIQRQRITYLKMTPSLFSAIVESPGFTYNNIRSLRLVVLGGEPIKVKDVAKAHAVSGHLHIINHYGPTETTIGCVAQFIDFTEFERFNQRPTIGNPIANMKAVILDKGGNLSCIGVPGELCISGMGVGRGYLNAPELTAEKFGPQTYRTGDLVRWLDNGLIEFLGRIDQQVKIRGYRIELGEIENRLLGHHGIKEAAVIDYEYDGDGGNKYLCAYIVCHEKERSIEPLELKEFILQKLPEYMVPDFFIEIEKIPLTANGKLNRKLLPEPAIKLQENYTSPRDAVEKKLAEIWGDVLGRGNHPNGIDDHFFHCGGHSLKAIILVSRIHKVFHLNIPLGEVFKEPTIRSLAEYIRVTGQTFYAGIEPVETKDYYELSSAQKRLYILQQVDGMSTGYNLPFAALLEGELSKDKLEKVFLHLIKRHESFRTSFEMIGDRPVQRIHKEVEFAVSDGSGQDSAGAIKNFILPFELSKAPLLRVGLLTLAEQKHLLVVDMHHIISDGISRRVLAEEFMSLYDGKGLPGLKLQYKDFAAWQNSHEIKEASLKQKSYWREQFEDEIPVLDLPTDFVRPALQSFEGDRLNFEIPGETLAALNKLALEKGVTLYMILLSLYYIFLAKLCNQEDIVVGSPAAGRRHADLERIIGMFVNTLALRNYPGGEKSFAKFLNEIKERSLKAFENQDYQYEDLVEEVVLTRDAGRNPLFDTMFVLQNTGTQEIVIPGLKLSPYEYENKTAKFDLTLMALEIEGKLKFVFEYSVKLFKEATVERFITYFINILNSAIASGRQKISEFVIITEAEKDEILYAFNNTERDYPTDKSIEQLFEEQVEQTPDYIALHGCMIAWMDGEVGAAP